jgi:rod shape-determining protein MreB
MVGRTPSHIVAVRPLVDGVISDFEITEQMLKYFFEKIQQQNFVLLPRPRVVIGIPHSVTEVERRAVEEGAINAGAREVYLIEEPIAAAIGARLPIQDASGTMIVDIGGGTTEVAVIALGGVVASRSLRIAGDEMNDDIIQYAREKFNLLLGERTAEDIKIKIGSAVATKDRREASMRGRDLVTGLPKEIIVNDEQIREAMKKSLDAIIESVRVTMEETPPELLADIMERGIVLSGGGAFLEGLDRRLEHEMGTKVYVADDPLTTVVRGTGLVLEDMDLLSNVLLPKEFNR